MALPTNAASMVPLVKRIWLPFLNLIGEKNEFRIIITSPDYIEFSILWGVIRFERGEKREFVVRGTEAYVKSIISSLEAKGLTTRAIGLYK